MKIFFMDKHFLGQIYTIPVKMYIHTIYLEKKRSRRKFESYVFFKEPNFKDKQINNKCVSQGG